ncbi:MAG: sigma-54-dependent Fis family transcriptional regulator [Bacteriovoracaceae bacterium]|jgi:two-component system, NtrC family, response regulator HydG|nr:sigma-54-dependent Fis family transcriptional regulator [Bacteriovoracaceae bacterium]
MLVSFSEFKFYQSFRVKVEEADDLRFLIERDNELGKSQYIDDAKLVDLSVTGLGFKTIERISVGTELTISMQFKKYHLDLNGKVVRAFCDDIDEEDIIYGIEIEEEKSVNRFIEQYILSFSSERLKECLIDSTLKERYTKASDGFEMFSLLLSLFKDITHFGDKEGFIDNMLEEVVRVMNAQRASIFLINPATNELEAVNALGMEKESLKFDYRLGIAGSVFTTGVALNIDTESVKTRFNDDFDKQFEFKTKSIICHPIHNREDKIVGVIEVLNKRNQDRFTVEDEKTMKVLSLIFSSVFHSFSPVSDKSTIRRFSTPFDRQYALIGKTPHLASLRNSIIKIKDIDSAVLIQGEKGVGKGLFAQILHHEGQRGLKVCQLANCTDKNISKELWNCKDGSSKLVECKAGTLIFLEICDLSMEDQTKLFEILVDKRLPNSKISLDSRTIATSSKDLGKLAEEGKFHQQLFEYFSRSYIYIEPLRRRSEDIDLLVDYFLKIECKSQGLLLKNFSPKSLEKLKAYDWPGNIQELKICVERAVLYNPKAHVLTDIDLENSASPLVDTDSKKRMFGDLPYVSDYHISLKDRIAIIEREMIISEIKRNNGNKSKAAKEMGISREALRKKLLQSSEILGGLQSGEKELNMSFLFPRKKKVA